MTELQPGSPDDRSPQPAEAVENMEDLLRSLRRKEGSWVEWGQACAKLQKAGYNPQAIFEQTGFEPIQQNQIIVAAQVYDSMLKAGVSEEVRSHYGRIGSDSLYELRILTQEDRAAVSEFLHARNLDSQAAYEVAKAVKDYSRLRTLPEGFTAHPGDAIAYQYWRYAKQQNDLPERSRLIARGLMFAQSQTARQQIERLLTQSSGTPQRSAPILPLYRLEVEEELPRISPVVGQLPLTTADLQNTPSVQSTGAFQLVQKEWKGALVALPGWQVILKAQDPVTILCNSSQLPTQLTGSPENLLLVIDRSEQEWDVNRYFLVDQAGQLQVQWFPEVPTVPILGSLLLVLRAKRILDEGQTKDLWQIDE